MLGLNEVRNDRDLLNRIDWDMTPEKAVSLYLEWGNSWNHGKYMIRSKDDVAYYFVVYAWDGPPVIHLVRRSTEEAVELAEIGMPPDVLARFLEEWGGHKGLYGLTADLRAWLQKELGATVH